MSLIHVRDPVDRTSVDARKPERSSSVTRRSFAQSSFIKHTNDEYVIKS